MLTPRSLQIQLFGLANRRRLGSVSPQTISALFNSLCGIFATMLGTRSLCRLSTFGTRTRLSLVYLAGAGWYVGITL
jgi:hypothetical protein